jgi:hypothetical protein
MKWLALVACVVCGGCGGAAAHRAADEYTGCGGDEQYRLLEDAEDAAPNLQPDLVNAPQMTQPSDGATIAFADKAIVQWNQSPTSAGAPTGDVPYMDGTANCDACCPQFNSGALTTLHLPVQTGDIYDLHVSVDGAYVWRIITTLQEWTPPDAQWADWKGHTVSIDFYRMTISANIQQFGPYLSRSYGFKIGS